eukprot:7380584-Prymnesium_polylepis.1
MWTPQAPRAAQRYTLQRRRAKSALCGSCLSGAPICRLPPPTAAPRSSGHAKANLEAQMSSGNSALMLAAMNGHEQ